MTREQTESLSNKQLDRINDWLIPEMAESDPYLVVALLKVIEQVGGGESIPQVGRLTRDDVMEPVRGVAQRCLPSLAVRDEAARAGRTLLRPIEVTPEPHLLRPAGVSTPRDEKMLLRASIPEE